MIHYNLLQYKNDENEVVRFLNSSAREFYDDNNSYTFKSYGIILKANLLAALIDIERVIKGVFGCDILMRSANINLLSKMFPNAFNNIFKVNSLTKMHKMGEIMEKLRNINAHAFLSKEDFDFFDNDFSTLNSQKTFNSRIIYFDKEITVAGIIFIIMNFLRRESIEMLIKKDILFSIIAFGEYKNGSGELFVTEISRVDLECNIRSIKGENVIESLIGEFNEFNIGSNSQFDINIGSNKYPTFKVTGKYESRKILIKGGSLSKIYYKDDYVLTIKNEKLFIHMSNLLPPFAFLDYLYSLKINEFDENTFAKLNLELIKKLNKPKFYVDKNIYILQLPSTISDFRLVSSIIIDSIIVILLQFENYVYKKFRINRKNGISSISKTFELLNISRNVIKRISSIRNFSAHGYNLNDFSIRNGQINQFSLKYISTTLCDLLDELKDVWHELYTYLKQLIQIYLLNVIISGKYKKAIIFGRDNIRNFPNINKKEMKIKNAFIDNSYIDNSFFDAFSTHFCEKIKVIKVNIEKEDVTLYLNDNCEDLKSLKEMIIKNNLKIVEIKEDYLKEYYLA